MSTNDVPGSTSDERLRAWLLSQLPVWIGHAALSSMIQNDKDALWKMLETFESYVKNGRTLPPAPQTNPTNVVPVGVDLSRIYPDTFLRPR